MRRLRAGCVLVVVVVTSGCALTRRLPFVSPFEGPVAEAGPDAAPMGHFIRGQAALNENDVDTAIVEFEKAVAEDPSSSLLQLRLAKLYLPLYKTFGPLERRAARNDPQAQRQMAPGQWQAENFADIPVFVIPCYQRNIKHHAVGWPQISVSSFYGSVYPAVQNLLLSCRAVGLGASLQTLPIWISP